MGTSHEVLVLNTNKKQKDSHSHHHSHDSAHDHNHSNDKHWLKAVIGLLWGAGLMVLALTGVALPMSVLIVLSILTSAVTLFLGINVYKSAFKSLAKMHWDTNTLYTISTLTILIVSAISLFVPGLPLMVEAAPFVLGFWHLGEAIEHSLLSKLHDNLDVRDCLPKKVRVVNGTKEYLSPKKVKVNDTLLIDAGGVIPVDGVLLEATKIYTTRVDGSPFLRQFQKGDAIKSGMQLPAQSQSVKMQATNTYEHSYLSQIANTIKKANSDKAPIELFTSRVLKYFIPTLLAIAVISGVIIGVFFTPALAIQSVVAVLVSACPCALSLITPMAVKIGMKKASEAGAVFDNGKTLQAAADIDAIVFDLNGTLTKGDVRVTNLMLKDKKYLAYLDLLESHSEHPLAGKIREHLSSLEIPETKKLTGKQVDFSHHSGISAIIDGQRFGVGNKHFLAHLGIREFPHPFDNPDNGSIYFTQGNQIIGQIQVEDSLRDDAIATVRHLQKLGKQVHICTGADEEDAKQYAKKLAIPFDNIYANAAGVESQTGDNAKTSYVKMLQEKGLKVAMVGDAANDLTALAYADLGIAVKSDIGDNITQQQAGIRVQNGALFPIVSAFDVSKKTRSNIYQNLTISLGYNSVITLVAAGALLAIGFSLNPAIGVALMVLESTIVLGNLYRLKQQKIVDAKSQLRAVDSTQQDNENSLSSCARALKGMNVGVRVTASPDSSLLHEAKTCSSRPFFEHVKKVGCAEPSGSMQTKLLTPV
jgi:P-type Cu2+ transporter